MPAILFLLRVRTKASSSFAYWICFDFAFRFLIPTDTATDNGDRNTTAIDEEQNPNEFSKTLIFRNYETSERRSTTKRTHTRTHTHTDRHRHGHDFKRRFRIHVVSATKLTDCGFNLPSDTRSFLICCSSCLCISKSKQWKRKKVCRTSERREKIPPHSAELSTFLFWVDESKTCSRCRRRRRKSLVVDSTLRSTEVYLRCSRRDWGARHSGWL